jgi:hypothetical protein
MATWFGAPRVGRYLAIRLNVLNDGNLPRDLPTIALVDGDGRVYAPQRVSDLDYDMQLKDALKGRGHPPPLTDTINPKEQKVLMAVFHFGDSEMANPRLYRLVGGFPPSHGELVPLVPTSATQPAVSTVPAKTEGK